MDAYDRPTQLDMAFEDDLGWMPHDSMEVPTYHEYGGMIPEDYPGPVVTISRRPIAPPVNKLKAIPISALRGKSVLDIRAQKAPVPIPLELADEYSNLSSSAERANAARWDLLLRYRRAVKELPPRWGWDQWAPLLLSHSDTYLMDHRTFMGTVQHIYRVPDDYVEAEEEERLRNIKRQWQRKARDIESLLDSLFPMMAVDVGAGAMAERWLDVRDLLMAMFWLNEKESNLQEMIARSARVMDSVPSARPRLVTVRDLIRAIILPVHMNADRRMLALEVIQAVNAGTCPVTRTAEHGICLTEKQVVGLLQTSRMSSLLVLHDSSRPGIPVTNLEAMFAPAVRSKLIRRKAKVVKMRKAKDWYMRRHCKAMFHNWVLRARWKRYAQAGLDRMERIITLSWAALAFQHWFASAHQHSAATSIQAPWRGYLTRATFLRAHAAQVVATACTNWWWFMTVEREEARLCKLQTVGATAMQTLVRGVLGRKRVMMMGMAMDHIPKLAWKLKMLRDGTLHRLDAVCTIQSWVRMVLAMLHVDRLFAKRRADEEAAEQAKQRFDDKERDVATRVATIELQLERSRSVRFDLDAQVKRQLQAANEVSTLRSKRAWEEKQAAKEAEAAAVRSQQANAMAEFNLLWDRKITAARAESRSRWEKVVYYKRPEDDPEAAAEWDQAYKAYMKQAQVLASKRRTQPEDNVVDAKAWFVAQRIADETGELNQAKQIARARIGQKLKDELRMFREKQAAEASMGKETAMAKIGNFVKSCLVRSVFRGRIRAQWTKWFDMLRARYEWFNSTTGVTTYAKPAVLGRVDVDIPNRWRVCYDDSGKTMFYFHARSHSLSWGQPQYTALCPRCSTQFVAFTCLDGCGRMCAACWQEVHPAADTAMATHNWEAKDGAAPVHYDEAWDNTDLYAAAAMGGQPPPFNSTSGTAGVTSELSDRERGHQRLQHLHAHQAQQQQADWAEQAQSWQPAHVEDGGYVDAAAGAEYQYDEGDYYDYGAAEQGYYGYEGQYAEGGEYHGEEGEYVDEDGGEAYAYGEEY